MTSQSELARLAGVNQSLISKIIAGKNETSKFTGKIAAALGVSADWLINGAGQMHGDIGAPHPKLDMSRMVDVWDENGRTDDVVTWAENVPDHFRAYIIKKNTGIAQVPAGSVVLVDPTIHPGNNDLIVTIIKGDVSAYRFLEGGSRHGFLAVDDERIPVSEVPDPSCIAGVAEQILVRKLRK